MNNSNVTHTHTHPHLALRAGIFVHIPSLIYKYASIKQLKKNGDYGS